MSLIRKFASGTGLSNSGFEAPTKKKLHAATQHLQLTRKRTANLAIKQHTKNIRQKYYQDLINTVLKFPNFNLFVDNEKTSRLTNSYELFKCIIIRNY